MEEDETEEEDGTEEADGTEEDRTEEPTGKKDHISPASNLRFNSRLDRSKTNLGSSLGTQYWS